MVYRPLARFALFNITRSKTRPCQIFRWHSATNNTIPWYLGVAVHILKPKSTEAQRCKKQMWPPSVFVVCTSGTVNMSSMEQRACIAFAINRSSHMRVRYTHCSLVQLSSHAIRSIKAKPWGPRRRTRTGIPHLCFLLV